MAVLTYNKNAVLQWQTGVADKAALYAMKNLTTGDTIDLTSDFLVVTQAAFMGVESNIILEAVSFTGTVGTMPAGLSAEAGYMLVWGESS